MRHFIDYVQQREKGLKINHFETEEYSGERRHKRVINFKSTSNLENLTTKNAISNFTSII